MAIVGEASVTRNRFGQIFGDVQDRCPDGTGTDHRPLECVGGCDFSVDLKSKRRRLLAASILAPIALVLAQPIKPATAQVVWEGSQSTDWTDPLNWVIGHTNRVPSAGEDVVLETISPNPTEINNSNVDFRDLYIGRNGEGRLSILNGSVVNSGTAYIARDAGNGSVSVSGSGTRWVLTPAPGLQDGYVAVGVHKEGALTVTDGAVVESYGGVLGMFPTGVGTVEVTGSGSRWTTRDALYIGHSNSGEMTISDGATVELLEPAADKTGNRLGPGYAYLSRLPGSNGTLNIGGKRGQAARAPGTFTAYNGLLFGDGTGTLVFNHTDLTGSYLFSPDLSSHGTGPFTGRHLIYHEAGHTTFTGDSSGFGGTTTISGGVLAVDGMLGGVVDVTGGLLAGTGGLTGAVNIGGGGSIAPAGRGTVGSLNVGDITFAAGSTYFVDVNAAGDIDHINASGTATINGGTVGVSGNLVQDRQYTILTAQDGVSGTFDTLSGNIPPDTLFLRMGLSYDTNHVYLRPVGNGVKFCDVASNHQAAECKSFDSLPTDNDVVIALKNQKNAQDFNKAIESLSGEGNTSSNGVIIVSTNKSVAPVKNRMRSTFGGESGNSHVSTYGRLADNRNGFWATGYGSWDTIDATASTAETTGNTQGFVFGIDREAFDDWRFGVLGGYANGRTSQDALLSSSKTRTWSLGLYGGVQKNGTTISFGTIYNWHDIDTNRTVLFPGFSQDLSAHYSGQSWQLFAEAGHEVQAGPVTVEPFAGVTYTSLHVDAYRETGGSAALSASASTQSVTFTTLGLRTAVPVTAKLRARGMAGWRNTFGDIQSQTTYTLAGSTPFTVLGSAIAEDALVGELGFEADVSRAAILRASYVGELGDSGSTHGFNAAFRSKF